MFKVSGLPVQITKSDLDELFSRYGKIQITKTSIYIKIEKDESWAVVQLDNNEDDAIRELDRRRWRDKYLLHLDRIRGDDIRIGEPGSGGTENKGTENKGTENKGTENK